MTIDARREAGQATRAPARLRRRAEFLRVAASGLSRQCSAFKVQAASREDAEGAPRFGFTVTKRVAGATARNRIRRRLKEALRTTSALAACKGYDYVFVARRSALSMPFPELKAQMAQALARLRPDSVSSNPRNRPQKP
jgi:ribonuclease P protein component